mmetsp:Transcript_50093/g.57646  ORF Transcript_50093/g.57646 Transcript_50093/m.57646 type:complete len:300 (+) Transcript_50093:36-935(+)|eukprot:CAMPEP_0176436418 /NCGR_PEP_ID=MMETSP0127-20121128/17958_1 /TAXON_ID=938130 /ORGANISM="Platyophrya macrostoma, Strain WH" /LENGTH=299 /DNA_ID=CAMNT_0017819737 /DNA_START=36 /DNA_END=935 /DNA_ORIENTATION=-
MGIYLSAPNTAKQSEDEKYENLKYGASGMQGWRTEMEDAHIAKYNIAPNVHIFGVFDGHGGKEVAIFVSKNFVKELLANESFKKKNYEKALTETFIRMDEILLSPVGKKELNAIRAEDGKSGYSESQAGCTANVALIVENTLYCANAGDSRCVLSCKGQAVEMSYDHKPDNEEEKARIHKAGGQVIDGRVNGNLNLSRAMGDLEYKTNSSLGPGEQLISVVPEIKVRQLTSDDQFIILGCDGIWEVKTNQEIVDFVGEKLKSSDKVSSVVESLLDALLAKDTYSGLGCDNMTCIIATLK